LDVFLRSISTRQLDCLWHAYQRHALVWLIDGEDGVMNRHWSYFRTASPWNSGVMTSRLPFHSVLAMLRCDGLPKCTVLTTSMRSENFAASHQT
jgi:hypothetical protein